MYQTCDPQMCLPPDVLLLEAEVEGSAGKTTGSSSLTADDAFKVVEQALKPLYDGFDDIDPGYRDLSYPEQLRLMDRQRRKIFAAGEAFIRQYPADERVFNVLQMCFPMFFPFFFDQSQSL